MFRSYGKHNIMTSNVQSYNLNKWLILKKRKRFLAVAFSFSSGSVYWVTGGEQETEGWVSSLFVRL